MELSISSMNTSGNAYANRLQEPRRTEQSDRTGQVSEVPSVRQQGENALQDPLQPARRAGDITSLDGSNRSEEKYSLYASQGNSLRKDIESLNGVFSSVQGVNQANDKAETESQGEGQSVATLRSNTQPEGGVAQNVGASDQSGTGLNSGGGIIRGNTAFPEALTRNYEVVSALSGYREASMQTQPVKTIDQTV